MKAKTLIKLSAVLFLAAFGAAKSHAADFGGVRISNGAYSCESGNVLNVTDKTLEILFQDNSTVKFTPNKTQDMVAIQQWSNKESGVQLDLVNSHVHINYGHGADELCQFDATRTQAAKERKHQDDIAHAENKNGKWKLYACPDGGIIEINGTQGTAAKDGRINPLRFRVKQQYNRFDYSAYISDEDGPIGEAIITAKAITIGFIGGGMMTCQAN